jgi:nucleotide-binding universal stress UspA family protein
VVPPQPGTGSAQKAFQDRARADDKVFEVNHNKGAHMMKYPKYKKVLFCTDFSENADHAFEYAYGIAKRDEGTLYILHVIPQHPNEKFLESMLDSEVLRKAREDYQKQLEDDYQKHYVKEMEEGVRFEIVTRSGMEDEEILKFARKEKVDLIVLGTHGKTGIEHALFGSIAEKVVRHSPFPVYIIPSKKKAEFPSKVYLYRGRERAFDEAPPKA